MGDAMGLAGVLRVGTVRAMDGGREMAQVWFDDSGITSDWLYVLKSARATLEEGDRALAAFLPMFNGDGFVLGGY